MKKKSKSTEGKKGLGEILLLIIIATFLMVVGAIFHERDIVRICDKQGNSGLATWTTKLECKIIK